MKRWMYALVIAVALAWAAPADAQTLGTFRWNTAPFCNVVNVTVIQHGGVYALVGYEEQCGGNPRLPVYGTAILQANGTIWLGWTTIFDFGNGLHTQATLASNLSGSWRDNANQNGTFVFTPGSVSGGPRITPIVPDGPVDARVEALAAEVADLKRLIAAITAGRK